MSLAFPMLESHLTRARSALNVLIDNYTAMAGKEAHAGDRADLQNYVASGQKLLDRLRGTFPGEAGVADVDLSPGELSVLERALRMSTAKWQGMIRPAMTPDEKAALKVSAQDVADFLSELRKARGLPW